jgi:hypothetical protein
MLTLPRASADWKKLQKAKNIKIKATIPTFLIDVSPPRVFDVVIFCEVAPQIKLTPNFPSLKSFLDIINRSHGE